MAGRRQANPRNGPLALTAALVLAAGSAQASCPVELAVYADTERAAELEFAPAAGSAILVSNRFRMLIGDKVLDGVVMWTDGVSRPWAMLMHQCPEGDVTGAEIDACTLWEGVVYASDAEGNIGLLPKEGAPAPQRLVFPDLGPALSAATAIGPGDPAELPFDVFALKGCQE